MTEHPSSRGPDIADARGRAADAAVVDAWAAFVAALYERGADLVAYVAERVAPLPPPVS